MTKKVKLSVSISEDLRRQLEEAREDNAPNKSIYGRHTLGEEVEELLRLGLKARAGGNYLTLQFDDGLWAWLTAYVKGFSLAGSLEDTAIYFIRWQLIEATKSKNVMELVMPHLPPSIRKAIGG